MTELAPYPTHTHNCKSKHGTSGCTGQEDPAQHLQRPASLPTLPPFTCEPKHGASAGTGQGTPAQQLQCPGCLWVPFQPLPSLRST